MEPDQRFDKLAAWARENGIIPLPPPTADPLGGTGDPPPVPLPDTPAAWFAARFPALAKPYGDAVEEVSPGDKKERPFVRDVSEDFLAATLGEAGSPNEPTVYAVEEGRFYTYSPTEGISIETQEQVLAARLSGLLLECARACAAVFDTESLAFKFRDSANLRGVLTRAQGLLAVKQDYFQSDLTTFIACNNGMLRVQDRQLLPFSPQYRRRNKLSVNYDPAATAPLFFDTLMRPALPAEDLDLLQQWSGMTLTGSNPAQRFIILTGTAGVGKGTFVRVLNAVIGPTNVGALRPAHLADHFEVGRLLGKSLLYGADVSDNFLNCKGASTLKALTGGDLVTLEFKGSNEKPQIVCRFNAIVTCNSRLRVHLEGDTAAWRRRLAIIQYEQQPPETGKVIYDLSERIIAEEGSGVLNWMLDGLDKIRADGWQLRLTVKQQQIVDDLLLESEAEVVFAKESLKKDEASSLTVPRAYELYVEFCLARNWNASSRKKFGEAIGDAVTRLFGLTVRNDIPDSKGKSQRGWKGLGLIGNAPSSPPPRDTTNEPF